jgi:type I restriction enzyme M protein
VSEGNHVQFIWGIAELLRGDYKRSEYGRVVLPFTVLRRLDLVLAPTKQAVLEEAARSESLDFDPDRLLREAAKQGFYNTSPLDLEKIAGDPGNVAGGLRAYMGSFSPTVREIFEAFSFDQQITRLDKTNLLYLVLTKFLDAGLDPETVSNLQMGDMFEELIRRFSEISNETAGEHFTPREVVRLCAELVLAGDEDATGKPGAIRKVYDPACGTGGMLSVTEELVREQNERARLYLYGQELNPETWAICRSEMLLKGQDPSHIHPGSVLSRDGLEGERFDLMLANPPFGVDWSKDEKEVTEECDSQGEEGRFGAGTPPKKDGALLFLQTMLAKRKPKEEGGSRIAIVFSGSPLFSGAAGSGSSEIRRWILENDWLEAIVALPEQLFYNTGIATYVWVLSNRKSPERQGKVQLIDGRDLWEPMPKSLGDKRRRLSAAHIEEILLAYHAFEETGRSMIRNDEEFLFRRIAVERPLRLRYEIDEAAIGRLQDGRAFENLVKPAANAKDPAQAIERGEAAQAAVIAGLHARRGFSSTDRNETEAKLAEILEEVEKPTAALRKAIWKAISVRDPTAPAVIATNGKPEPDPDLRDHENVPFTEAIGDYMDREVLPFVADAWVDESKEKIGSEIPFTRLFHRYEPPRPLEEIDREIRELEAQIEAFTREDEETGPDWTTETQWPRKRLRFLTSINARQLAADTPPDQVIRYMDISSVDGNGTLQTPQSMQFSVAPSRARRLARPGDTAISTVRTYLKAIAFVDEDYSDCVWSTGFAILSPGPELDPKFLFYTTRSAWFLAEIERRSVGISYPAVNVEDLADIFCPVPPLDEQRRISARLDEANRKLGELAGAVDRQLALLEERRATLIATAITGELDTPPRATPAVAA